MIYHTSNCITTKQQRRAGVTLCHNMSHFVTHFKILSHFELQHWRLANLLYGGVTSHVNVTTNLQTKFPLHRAWALQLLLLLLRSTALCASKCRCDVMEDFANSEWNNFFRKHMCYERVSKIWLTSCSISIQETFIFAV